MIFTDWEKIDKLESSCYVKLFSRSAPILKLKIIINIHNTYSLVVEDTSGIILNIKFRCKIADAESMIKKMAIKMILNSLAEEKEFLEIFKEL